MSKELSRRKFLERIGLGTAAGASLSLLKDVASARPTMWDPWKFFACPPSLSFRKDVRFRQRDVGSEHEPLF
jgi:hypothetical protein